MKNFKEIQDAILNAIDTMIESKIKKLKFNYYVDGVIKKVNTDNTYNVLIDNREYKDIPAKNNFEYFADDAVQILIKNGNWNKKIIDDKITHNEAPLKDYIIEQGTKGKWEYRKWASGKMEAWGIQPFEISTVNGGNALTFFAPIMFVGGYLAKPSGMITVESAVGNPCTQWTEIGAKIDPPTTGATMQIHIYGLTAGYLKDKTVGDSVDINIFVTGRWK